MSKSAIEWTDETWNPVTGCTKVSAGCKHCYAEREWPRMTRLVPAYAGRDFTDVRTHPDRSVKVGQPLFAYPPDAQAEIAKRDARIETLEIRLSGFSDLTGLMQSSLEGDTSRISELLDQNEKQASEIARLKAVIAKCKETISGMQEWFEAEDNHAGTTFYERMDMCKNVQVKTVEALAAIKEEGL